MFSPGDAVLMYETGHFATLWKKMAEALGLKAEFLGDPGIEGWRRGVQADRIEARLREDSSHAIKAVCVVHNETSTGVTSDIAAVRRALDASMALSEKPRMARPAGSMKPFWLPVTAMSTPH